MSSRANYALAPEWHDADSVAVDALYHEFRCLPGDELVKVLETYAARELKHALEAAAENKYADMADNGDDD